MYKMLNFLFGWDYVIWENSCDAGIARIRVDCTGRLYYYRYRITSLIDPIENKSDFFWLTCKPSKYLGEDK